MSDNPRNATYRVLRYAPNLVRDEWVNIGVLVFDERAANGGCDDRGAGRVRARATAAPAGRRRTPARLRNDLENRFATATISSAGNGQEGDTPARNGAPTG